MLSKSSWFLNSAKPSLRTRLPRGLWRAIRLLRNEIAIARAHHKGARVAKSYAERVGTKLNIGCGSCQKEGWVNIDLLPNVDLSFDLREPIPLPSGSSSIIYSEHFLEHLDYPEDAKSFLSECYRLLEPGGRFSVGVPDTEWALREYVGLGDGRYFELARSIWHPSWCRTRLEHINYHFRQDGEHRFAYDFETLQQMLAEIGFAQIGQRSFDPTLDSEHRRLGTLYVNAVKPG